MPVCSLTVTTLRSSHNLSFPRAARVFKKRLPRNKIDSHLPHNFETETSPNGKREEKPRVLFSFVRSLSLFHGSEDQNSVHVAHGRVAHRCGARPKERRVREMVETDFARHDCRARRRTGAVDRLVGTTETTESER